MHYPSVPINPVHPRVYEYVLHAANVATQPLPDVTQPVLKLLQAAFVDKVVAASEH